MAEKKQEDKTKLTFKFETEEAAKEFKSWLCEQGEQDYWIWMEEQETQKPGKITALEFDYSKSQVIPVKCGRMDDKEG